MIDKIIGIAIIFGIGIVLGMYISSQIKCAIRKNIFINNIKKHDEKEKIKQQESKVLGQKPVKGKTNKRKETTMHDATRV